VRVAKLEAYLEKLATHRKSATQDPILVHLGVSECRERWREDAGIASRVAFFAEAALFVYNPKQVAPATPAPLAAMAHFNVQAILCNEQW
jgi:hypothetical protein